MAAEVGRVNLEPFKDPHPWYFYSECPPKGQAASAKLAKGASAAIDDRAGRWALYIILQFKAEVGVSKN